MSIVDWIYPRKCVGCGVKGAYVCGECKRSVEVRGQSLRYGGVVRKLIKAIKYRGSWDMVAVLVDLWEEKCGNGVDGEWVVTAVPMWETKRKLRGYNQAELIARELAKRWGIPYKELLVRTRETKPMYGLKRGERVENMRGAFRILNHYTIRPLHQCVVLVDDVWTSGATMNECAHVLRDVGMKKVVPLAIAS